MFYSPRTCTTSSNLSFRFSLFSLSVYYWRSSDTSPTRHAQLRKIRPCTRRLEGSVEKNRQSTKLHHCSTTVKARMRWSRSPGCTLHSVRQCYDPPSDSFVYNCNKVGYSSAVPSLPWHAVTLSMDMSCDNDCSHYLKQHPLVLSVRYMCVTNSESPPPTNTTPKREI